MPTWKLVAGVFAVWIATRIVFGITTADIISFITTTATNLFT